MLFRTFTGVLLISALTIAVSASQPAEDLPALFVPSLKVGDPAPALKPSDWINGEPVESFEPGTIYVIECWSTWCGAKDRISRLSEMNTRFKDRHVVFIGLNVGLRHIDQPPENRSTVESFLARMGEKMNFRVALDAKSVNVAAWMQASGQQGIPCCFVVDQAGKLACLGYLEDALGKVIDSMLDGSFDNRAEANKQATKQAKLAGVAERFSVGLKAADMPAIEAAIDEVTGIDPIQASTVLTDVFGYYFKRQRNYPVAYRLATDAVGKVVEEWGASGIGLIALTILEDKDVPEADRKVDVALKLALRADEFFQHKNTISLDILALAYFWNGDRPHAIEVEKLAVSLAGNLNTKWYQTKYERALARYQSDPFPGHQADPPPKQTGQADF